LRRFFRSENINDNDLLRSNSSTGHSLIFIIMAKVLSTDGLLGQIGDNLLQMYAAKHWRTHLLLIKPSKLNNAQLYDVADGLYRIITNTNRALSAIEQELDPKASVLGKSQEEIDTTINFVVNLSKHIKSQTLEHQKSPAVEWIITGAGSRDKLLMQIARGHINSWLDYVNIRWDSMQSFHCAHEALRLGKDALKHDEKIWQYFNSLKSPIEDTGFKRDAVFMVMNVFPDLEKTPMSCMALYGVLGAIGKHRSAIGCMRASLENDLSITQRRHLLNSISYYLCDLLKDEDRKKKKKKKLEQYNLKTVNNESGDLDENVDLEASDPNEELQGSRDERVRECLDSLHQASAVLPPLEDLDLEKDMDSKTTIFDILWNRWHIDLLGEDFENISKIFAICNQPLMNSSLFLRFFLFIENLYNIEKWDLIMQVLEIVDIRSRRVYITTTTNEDADDFNLNHRIIQEAAVKSNKTLRLLEIYVDSYKWITVHWAGGYLFRIRFAAFCSQTIRDPVHIALAKRLLNQVLDSTAPAVKPTTLSAACFALSDIIFEEFRGTCDPRKKAASCAEARALLNRLSNTMGPDFDPSQSQISIPIALMYRN
jgi:hypothetical protein